MRSVPEWVGTSDDTAIPARVRLRIFDAAKRRCQDCGRAIRGGDTWECDHIKAIANAGGENRNRERNLQCLCGWCHAKKTKADVAEKSTTARKAKKAAGITKTKWRPMAGTKASGLKKRMDGTVERR